MPKKKATAAQLRNLAKGRKKLAAMRRAGKVRRRKSVPRKRPSRRRNPDVSPEAWELILWSENSRDVQNQRDSIIKNVIRKINSGKYDASKAPRLWQYLMDSAAKSYTKEFGNGRGYGIFTPAIRREAAAWIAPREYESIANGEYSHLLALKPKTARKKKTRKKRAAKRNPAHGNFLTARKVLRTGRTANPVRPLNGVLFYLIMRGKRYFTGYSFSQQKALAVRYVSLGAAKAAAQKLADRTGSDIRIVDARKP